MKKKGFTLIELAIALTVIGLMVGGSFQAVKAMRERTKVSEAKEQLMAAKDAVMGYALKWPNLPSNQEFDQNLSYATGSQNPIFYAVDPTLATINNDICAFNTTNLSVVDNSVSPARNIPDVVFVLAHGSANSNMQTALITSTTPNKVNIYAPSTKVDDSTTPINRASDEYDDVVKWVTLSELQQRVDCSQNKLVIINDYALPRDINSSANYIGANIYADGGFPFTDGDGDGKDDYEWCIEDPYNTLGWLNSKTCNGILAFQADCSAVAAVYSQCTSLNLQSNVHPVENVHRLNIYVKDKTKTIQKSFTITIDVDNSGGTGGACIPGTGAFNSYCTSDSDCQTCQCNTASNKCK